MLKGIASIKETVGLTVTRMDKVWDGKFVIQFGDKFMVLDEGDAEIEICNMPRDFAINYDSAVEIGLITKDEQEKFRVKRDEEREEEQKERELERNRAEYNRLKKMFKE